MINSKSYNVKQLRSIVQERLLSQEFTIELLRVVMQYLVLSGSDLQCWQEDPESFCLEEESDAWQYNTRPCAEKVSETNDR